MKTKNCYNRLMTVLLTIIFVLSFRTGTSQTFPNCPGTATLTAVQTGCFDYEVSVQTQNMLSVLGHTWSVNGSQIPPPTSFASFSLFDLAAGTYVICLKIRYVSPEGVECESEFCTTIEVPSETVDPLASVGFANVYYCPLGLVMSAPMYNPCDYCGAGSNYFELFSNSTLVLNSYNPNACTPRPLGANDVINCYETHPDGRRCLKNTIQLVPMPMNVTTVTQAGPVLSAACGATNISHQINLNPPYTEFVMTGPGNFQQSGILPQGQWTVPISAPGNYMVEYCDKVNCVESEQQITVIFNPWKNSQCTINVEDCEEIEDPATLNTYLSTAGCTDCYNTINSATTIGPWVHSFTPGMSSHLLTREYADVVNCQRCTLTVKVPLASDPSGWFQEFETDCHTLLPGDLPSCFQDKQLTVRITDGSDDKLSGLYNEKDPLELCCENIYGMTNPTYYFYSEEIPCCFFAVRIKCQDEAPPAERLTGLTITDTAPNETLSADRFRIVPNPASSVFRIESNTKNEIYEKVEIRDMNSRSILTKTKMHSGTELDISKFNRGTYFVTVTTGEGSVTLKLVTTGE